MLEEYVSIDKAAGSEGIKVLKYDESMYDTFKEWWETYKMEPVPKGCLADPAFGIVLKDKGVVWLYEVAPVKVEADHIIVNPAIRGSERKKIQENLLKIANRLIEEWGYTDLFFIASNKMLINTYKSLGFEECDAKVMKRSHG